ncbi:MAG: ABC transporter permease [Chloroflexi bacterium]|nr:ABC transporter permease [Chloroflexota bacterium]
MANNTVIALDRLTVRSGTRQVLYVLRRWPVIPIFIIAVLIACAIFAPWIAPKDPLRNSLFDRNDEPFWYAESTGKFVLGADPLGRDILSRIIHGARVSMMVAAISISMGVIVGTTLGLISGYFGGIVDELIVRLLDINAAIPFLLLALIVVMVFGQSLAVLMGVLALSSWAGPARLVRGQTLQLKTLDYVALARVAGASTFRILYKHILPGVVSIIVVTATLEVGSIILAESILSFLGAGIPPPTPAWGSMVAEGRDYLGSAWWVAFFPGMAIFLTVLAFNFLGDWIRDRWDPRLRQL